MKKVLAGENRQRAFILMKNFCLTKSINFKQLMHFPTPITVQHFQNHQRISSQTSLNNIQKLFINVTQIFFQFSPSMKTGLCIKGVFWNKKWEGLKIRGVRNELQVWIYATAVLKTQHKLLLRKSEKISYDVN